MVIYWNSNANILIIWDTDFLLLLAVRYNHLNKKKCLKWFTLHVMNLKYMNVWNKLQEKNYFFTIIYFVYVSVHPHWLRNQLDLWSPLYDIW